MSAAWARQTRFRRGRPCSTGIQAANPDTVFAPDQASALAEAGTAERLCRCGRREGLCRGAGRQPGTGPAGRPEGADHGAAGHRQAGHRGRHRRTTGRSRPGRERGRRADGLPGRHRDRPGRRRRAVRQGQPERQAADQLAIGRAGGRRRFQRHRALAAGRSAQVLRPTPGHRFRARATPTTRCIRSGSACPTRRSRTPTSR